MVGQRHTGIPRLGSLRPLWRVGAGSLFELIGELIGEVRAFLSALGIAVGISVGLSSASAEIEEVSNQDGYISDRSGPALTQNLFVNLLVNNYDDITGQLGEYYLAYNMLYSDRKFNSSTHWDKSGQSTNLDKFGEAIIPETIWSLDVSTGIHFDHVSDEFGLEIVGQTSSHLLTGEIIGQWIKNANISSSMLLLPPFQFQVASCNDRSAERNNLEHCNTNYESLNQYANEDTDHNNGNGSSNQYTEYTELNNGNGSATESNSTTDLAITSTPNSPSIRTSTPIQTANATSTFIQETHPDTVHDLSLLIPPNDNSLVLQGHLKDVSTPSDQCDDVSASCATIQIDPPIPPIDSPAPPDTLDPGPLPDPLPISTPPPIPETSTWIMIMIGFGTMVVVCQRRSRKSPRSLFTITLASDLPCDEMGDDDAEARLSQPPSL
jgi:hypothetical protein